MRQKIFRILPVLLPLSLVFITGFKGLNFGFQWDEKRHYLAVQEGFQKGTLLPGFYYYPSMCHWLNLIGTVPYFLKNPSEIFHLNKEKAQNYTTVNISYSVDVRTVYLTVSCLAILWIYLFLLFWRNSVAEALLGASLLGFSWEYAYHSRFVAPDVIMMQFGCLTILCLYLFHAKDNSKKWLYCSAIAAGLGFATKYPGGLLLVPLLIAVFQYWRRWEVSKGLRALIERAIVAGSIFGITFFAVTPGAFIEGRVFKNDLMYELVHYKTLGHGGYNVQPGLDHFKRILVYFGLDVFSYYWPVSLLFFAFVFLGIFAIWKESKKLAALLFSFPLLYVLYFTTPRVMIIRNLMIVVPFLVVFSTRGIFYFLERLKSKSIRYSFAAVICVCLFVNATWLAYASYTIQTRNPTKFAKDLIAYIQKNPDKKYFISSKVAAELKSLEPSLQLSNVQNTIEGADEVVFYINEWTDNIYHRPANLPGLTTKVFGPWEINIDYYTTWMADDRIVVVSEEKVRKLKIPIR